MVLDMDGYSIDFDRWCVTSPKSDDMPIELMEINGRSVDKEPAFDGVVEINAVFYPSGEDSDWRVKLYMTGKESGA